MTKIQQLREIFSTQLLDRASRSDAHSLLVLDEKRKLYGFFRRKAHSGLSYGITPTRHQHSAEMCRWMDENNLNFRSREVAVFFQRDVTWKDILPHLHGYTRFATWNNVRSLSSVAAHESTAVVYQMTHTATGLVHYASRNSELANGQPSRILGPSKVSMLCRFRTIGPKYEHVVKGLIGSSGVGDWKVEVYDREVSCLETKTVIRELNELAMLENIALVQLNYMQAAA